MRLASIQFVRKISGSTKPSRANAAPFDTAVAQVTDAVRDLLQSLVTEAPPKNRELEAEKARARAKKRYGAVPAARV